MVGYYLFKGVIIVEKSKYDVLDFFAGIELLLGIWMVSPTINNVNFIRVIHIYSPLWILGVIFIIGGVFQLAVKQQSFWRFVILTSTPLTFFGLVYLQVVSIIPSFWGATIVTLMAGIFSAVYAGKIFSKVKSEM